jgi:hypothetical protein
MKKGDKKMSESTAGEVSTIRERLSSLDTILSESLEIMERIDGTTDEMEESIGESGFLEEIERWVDRVIEKAYRLTGKLHRMEDRM